MRNPMLRAIGGIKGTKAMAAAVVSSGLLIMVSHFASAHEPRRTRVGVESAAQTSPSSGVTKSTKNPLQIAILHWYDANLTTTFKVGTFPSGAVFDGANVWVAQLFRGNRDQDKSNRW